MRRHDTDAVNRRVARPQPGRPRRASWTRRGLGLLALLAVLTLAATPAWARKGDARAGLFLGTTTFTVDEYRTFGTQFGGFYGIEVEDDLLWSFGGAFTSTEGEEVVDVGGTPTLVRLQATTSAFRTGLSAYFNSRGLVIPYIGAGISYMNYNLDYPNTTIGNTSGAGPGAYAQGGIEFRLTRQITVIPQFGLEVHTIRTQTGESKGLLSGGLSIIVRIAG